MLSALKSGITKARGAIGGRTGTSALNAPPDLPEDWSYDLGDDEIAHLYDESAKRLRDSLEMGEQQEAKAFLIARFSLLLLVASGIFGDLQLGSGIGATTIASWSALLLSALVGLITLFLITPKSWQTGINIASLAHWSRHGEDVTAMKAAALEIAVAGFVTNYNIVKSRGGRLKWLLIIVVLQAVCVVSVQVVSALIDQAPSDCCAETLDEALPD